MGDECYGAVGQLPPIISCSLAPPYNYSIGHDLCKLSAKFGKKGKSLQLSQLT